MRSQIKKSKRPAGGKAKRANYDTVMVRVPVPVQDKVQALIDEFHKENAEYLSLPIQGMWWEVLGVNRSASADEVKTAWRILAQKYHPDVNKRRDAEDRIKAVNRAYETYKNQKHFHLE